jgi:hypothetical protein
MAQVVRAWSAQEVCVSVEQVGYISVSTPPVRPERGPEADAEAGVVIGAPVVDSTGGSGGEGCVTRIRRLHHVFESACDKDPSAIALECGDEQLTYRELDEHANRLAHHLRSFGVVGGARVAILPQRSVDTYVALLGVGKAGAAFVPIDPESPATTCSTDGHAPGAWAAIHDALRDLVRVYEGRDPLPTAGFIDSQSVRAGDTVTRASRGYDAGKKTSDAELLSSSGR